jgi:adenylate cyclase
MQENSKNSKDNFQKSKWTIQAKLLTIISLVVTVSLSGMIVFATLFFKRDSEQRAEENNIKFANLIGLKVKTDISSIIEKINLMYIALNKDFKDKADKDEFLNLFFKNDPNFIYFGVYEDNNENDRLVSSSSLFNQTYLNDYSISSNDLKKIIDLHSKEFSKSFQGEIIIHNASQGFTYPIIGLSVPIVNDPEKKQILISLFRVEKIINAFENSGLRETFMVNNNGTVIAHSNPKIVQSGKNLLDYPIVKTLLKSQVDNGQIRFQDDDGNYHLGAYEKLAFVGAGVISTILEDKAYEEVYNIQRRNIYFLLITFFSATLIIFIFSKTISKPILNLVSATNDIEKGNFRPSVQPTTSDEIGLLTHSFISMGLGLEEREKVKSILGNMIDPTVVEEAMKDLAALKRGSEKNITAFFSDVASFSTISEQLNSADLASLLNEYLSAMTIILKEHDGVLDKYIGDAIVGIFNAPIDVAQHELKAARASLDMIIKLRELKEIWVQKNSYSKDAQQMGIRIGLNCGPAKVGFMGTDALASYTMMGDTVNLAARLEAAGKDYGTDILISEMINNKISDEMFTRDLDLVRVKGKTEPVKLFELIARKSEITSSRKEAAEIYMQGFKAYLSRDWEKAIKLFHDVHKARGEKDKASDLLIDRCEYFVKSPPQEDWDGVFTRKHK